MPNCPVCQMSAELVSIGVHLMTTHRWDYEQVQEWMRGVMECD